MDRIGIQPEMPDPDLESVIRIRNKTLKILSQMIKHVNCEGLNVNRNLYFIILQENRLRTISLTLKCHHIWIQLLFG
jgi:hypothetical protein